jgi:ribosomal protein S18 acetylase RimI-like enzyme
LNSIKEKGFIPKQLFFAIKRFHRWYKLNSHATLEAQAEMLSELFDTYNLPELEKIQKSTRTRFFLETVFSDSKESFRKALYDLINRQKNEQLNNEELIEELSKIQHEFTLTKKESFFLTRLSYPHIKPTDTAAIMSVKGEGVSAANLVVELEDYDGNSYFIRSPISPKEISRLHQLFIDASLLVHFRPEHRFLVALSERGYIIGGLFYTLSDNRTAHMEKIVVSNKYRRKGISEGLMNEFFNRMRDANNKYVTTGFFRPEYFYRFGFKIERKYSGLVKEL